MPSLSSTSGHLSPVSNRGFTLIEILVAISILGISLVVVLQLFSGALKSVRVSNEYTRGVFHAQEKIEEILLREVLTSGAEAGEFDDGYQWRAEILLMEQAEEEASKLPFDMFQIAVDVTWDTGTTRGGKHFQLITLKVVKKGETSEPEALEVKEGKD